MNTAYLRRCADEERRAKIAAGFTMCATAPDDPSPAERHVASLHFLKTSHRHHHPPTPSRPAVTA